MTQVSSKRVEKVYHLNANQRKDSVAILILAKVEFKTRSVIRNKENHFIMIKVSTLRMNNIDKSHRCYLEWKQADISIHCIISFIGSLRTDKLIYDEDSVLPQEGHKSLLMCLKYVVIIGVKDHCALSFTFLCFAVIPQ